MNPLINYIKKHELLKDNLILFLGNSCGAFFTFLFHFYMGRRLGPEGYGVLGAVLALIYLFTIPLTTIQTSIAKFVSNFKSEKRYREINYLHKASIKKLFIFGLISAIIFILLSNFIADYLHISKNSLLILSLYIVFSLLLYINRGILQGLQKFKKLSLNLISEGFVKLVLGIIFILIGLRVNGAVGAIVAALIFAFFISIYQIKDIFKEGIKKFDTSKIYRYTIPVLITLISLTAFYSLDIILVKHFFTDKEAGYYSAISLLGKIIFFGSMPISQVMFPKSSALYNKKKSSKSLMYKSILMISIFSLPVILLYFLFPNLIINLVYGSSYLDASSLLGWFGIVMFLFSMIYLIAFYSLSLHKKNFLYILLLFNVLQIVLIYLFHETLAQVVSILTVLMFVLLCIVFLKATLIKDGKTFNNNSSL